MTSASVEQPSDGPLEPHELPREKLRTAPPTVPDEHTRCPYCHDDFAVGLARAGCWACKSPHHARCLAEHGGCSVFGCEGGPRGAQQRPLVIRTVHHRRVEEDWRVTRRRERAQSWSAQQRSLNRTSGLILGLPALVVLSFFVAAPLPLWIKLPTLALLGSFFGACVADVLRPQDHGVGRALGLVHLVSGGNDQWMR